MPLFLSWRWFGFDDVRIIGPYTPSRSREMRRFALDGGKADHLEVNDDAASVAEVLLRAGEA
jgi:hypothetical protein